RGSVDAQPRTAAPRGARADTCTSARFRPVTGTAPARANIAASWLVASPRSPPAPAASPASSSPSSRPGPPAAPRTRRSGPPAAAAYRRMGRDWQHKPSVYGPVFTLGSEGLAHAAGDSPRSATRAFRIVAAVAMVALAALASLWGSFAAAFVGWSPLLALHFAGGGHNDVLMMLFVLAALAAGRAGRYRWAGPAWV